jgi:hypothetical protein
MRFRRGSLHRLFIPLLALAARPALSQNLLVNPGFDRDLSGWTSEIQTYPDPAHGDVSAGWTPTDATGNFASGGLALHARTGYHETARLSLSQCLAESGGRLVSFGGTFLTARQFATASTDVEVAFFASFDCSGAVLSSETAASMPFSGYPETNSNGRWLPAASAVLSSPATRSMRVSVLVFSVGTSFFGSGYVDAVADDVYATVAPAAVTTWILPSAGWVHGAAGSYWSTQFTLCNPGSGDAAVTLKWLGHDLDGRFGPGTAYVVRAGETLVPDEETWQINHSEDWGAILVTSSSPVLVVQSETSTYVSGGGTVGQALPAFGPADFARATPKTLAPIRENSFFRTNLVLANATVAPLTVHVALYAADGTPLGTRDVDLPPLGMTQISRVASALGAATLDTGRIEVSTPTPGGLVAAYASVIDNTTNDPRTILPQDGLDGAPVENLLANPGFDHDLAGWTLERSALGIPEASADWTASDASGNAASGGLALHAFADIHDGVVIDRRQCLPLVSGNVVTFGAKFLTARQSTNAGTGISVYLFSSTDCSEPALGVASATSLASSLSGETSSQGAWLQATASSVIPSGARSMGVYLRAFASGTYHPPNVPSSSGYVDAVADDVFATVGPDPTTRWILPSAAWIHGATGSTWATRFTLVNPGWVDASVTLRWLGHDVDGRNGRTFMYGVRAGQTLSVPVEDWEANFAETWGAILVTSSSPVLLQSETSAPASGGSVGQALAAMSPANFAGATPKTLAPIRENASFRTNLILANATEAPLTAHVALFAADSAPIGSRNVDLPPLGMTQINNVAASLGASTLDAGRISVSTSTPGGLVAAYASVIDNVTNDPRTILPR